MKTENMAKCGLHVFLIRFYHLKENQLSLRISCFSLKSKRKRWASPASKAQSTSVHQSFTQALNSVVGMFSPLVVSKVFSQISAPVIGISFLTHIVIHSPVKLLKAGHFGTLERFCLTPSIFRPVT